MSSNTAPQGAFFAIESTDPITRSEQFSQLISRLEQDGYDVAAISFPRYDHASSHFAKAYQSGSYGQLDDVGPYTSSVFYALDRYEAAKAIRTAVAEGKVVIANRFTGSNMAQQGTKFDSSEQRRGYFIWLDNMEFEMLKVPRPERSFILRLPAELSDSADYEQQKLLVQVYDELAMLFPKDYIRIDCSRDGKKVDAQNIQQLLYQAIEPFLPAPTTKNGSVHYLNGEAVAEEDAPTVTSHKVTGLERLQLPALPMSIMEGDYYIPALKGALKEAYITTLESVYAVREKLLKKLSVDDAVYADALLPLATYYDSPLAVRPARYANKAIQQFALTELKTGHDTDLTPVVLTSYSPRNELELVTDVLYPYTSHSYKELKTQTEQLTYTQKEKLLSAYLQQATKNEQALDAHYAFDILCDQAMYDHLRTVLPAIIFSLQPLTPRYGYAVPDVIEQSGMVDEYIDCFDKSLTLSSDLQAAGFVEASQYSLLRGHKFRCRFSTDLTSVRLVHKSLLQNKNSTIAAFATELSEVLAQAHPLVAEFL